MTEERPDDGAPERVKPRESWSGFVRTSLKITAVFGLLVAGGFTLAALRIFPAAIYVTETGQERHVFLKPEFVEQAVWGFVWMDIILILLLAFWRACLRGFRRGASEPGGHPGRK